MTEAEKRIREALADPALFDEGASSSDTLNALADFIAACNPAAIRELLAERDALLEALQHMQHCASCAEDYWQNCEGGRAALAAIDAAKGKE